MHASTRLFTYKQKIQIHGKIEASFKDIDWVWHLKKVSDNDDAVLNVEEFGHKTVKNQWQ